MRNIIHLERGIVFFIRLFLFGHENDAQQYQHMRTIGPAEELEFPEVPFFLLVDRYTHAQISKSMNNQR